MTREEAIENIISRIPKDALVITCNGKIGRELYEIRKKRGEPNDDFIMIGSMGCALPIAIGVALHTIKEVYCLIGDGNLLMKFGSLATYLHLSPKNLRVIVLNNGKHDSTGGQDTYFYTIRDTLPFKVIDVEPGARSDLGRPTITPEEMKIAFMKKVAYHE